jgi:hypothetical protein
VFCTESIAAARGKEQCFHRRCAFMITLFRLISLSAAR